MALLDSHIKDLGHHENFKFFFFDIYLFYILYCINLFLHERLLSLMFVFSVNVFRRGVFHVVDLQLMSFED